MRALHVTPEYPPVIWGGLGTAVGGLVSASARSGMTVGVLLVGGALVLGPREGGGGAPGGAGYGRVQPGFHRLAAADGKADPERVQFFQVPPAEAAEAGVYFSRQWKPDV